MPKMNIQRKLNHGRSAWGRRLTAFALSLAMAFLLLPAASARAAGTEDYAEACRTDDLYLLRVDTGLSAGVNVKYLGVRFKDRDGVEHTEFILPHEGDLAESYARAEKNDVLSGKTYQNRLSRVKTVTKYSPIGYEKLDGLRSNSMDSYLFSPHYEVDTLLGVDVFLRYPMSGENTKGWTCSGIYLYEVEELYGLGMVGYYSNDYYIRFSGTMLGYLDSGGQPIDFTLGKSDQIFRIGRDKDSGYRFVTAKTAYSNVTDRDDYLFKIDFADEFSGGIEALASELKDEGRLLHPVEALDLVLTYQDSLGQTRHARLPAVTSALSWAVERGFTDSLLPIAGIAQQGESLIFTGTLPDFASVTGAQLIYGPEAAEYAEVSLSIGLRGTERLNAMTEDQINLAGLSIYGIDAASGVKKGHSPAELDLFLAEGVTPLYYYTSPLASGDTLTVGGSDFRLKSYTAGAPLKPVNTAQTYIVEVSTDNVDAAATTEELELTLTYLTKDGSTKTTRPIVLSEAAQDFYGYWPGTEGDVSYRAGLSAGSTLAFPVQIQDVSKFVSATFSMNSKATDDWQMTEIAIYMPGHIGERIITWKDIGVSNRTITREYDRKESCRIAWYPNALDIAEAGKDGPEKLYMNGKNNRKTVTFRDSASVGPGRDPSHGGITDDDHKTVDWSELRYSMSYKEALQDLGFTRAAVTYAVNVSVAGNDGSGSADDSGSNNLFYFKLIFEDGCSGYVLANQQLEADGFRAGRVESFYISTNEDYGDLSAISIIPETESSSDNRDVFDKLKIEEITVTKGDSLRRTENETAAEGGGMSQSWKIENVGWIGIEYFDQGGENTVNGRAGLTEGELSRTYTVTQSGYSLNLLFSMTTGSYDKRVTDVDYTPGSRYQQYQGTLNATVEYYNSADELKQVSVDVARAMYEYADKIPQFFEDASGNTLTEAKVDTGFMLRAGHVDRFIVQLPDVKQLLRIRFDACSTVSTTWRLENVGVWLIKSPGVLQIARNGEYKRTNRIEPLCESTSTVGYSLKTMAPDRANELLGEEQELTVSFTPNTIDISESAGTWGANIKREPLGKNDTVNLYVYMDDTPTATNLYAYGVNAALQYRNSNDDSEYQVSVQGMRRDSQRNMFYATGLKVDGMDTASFLSLEADAFEYVDAPMKYVVIQHLRSGVTIDTLYVDASKLNLSRNPTFDLSSAASRVSTQQQVVRLFFSPDMDQSFPLAAEKNDLVVGIRYQTVNDVGGTEFSSRYVYLTDLTDTVDGITLPRYTEIGPGMIAEIPFTEDYISKITGVVLASVGNVKAKLESACVGIYDAATGALTDWYSFAEPRTLTTTPQSIAPTLDTVVPILMRFTTNESAMVLSSGTDSGSPAPIRVGVTYVNARTGVCETVTYPDIRNYLTEGGFTTDEQGKASATVRFFMQNVGSIRYLTLEPYTSNPYGSAVWGLESVYCETVIDKAQKNRSVKVGQAISQDSPASVNFSAVLVELEASCYDEASGVLNRIAVGSEGSGEITIGSGQSLTITPKISGSVDGMGYKVMAQQKIAGALTDVFCFHDNFSAIRFTPPENPSHTDIQIYVVTVRSEEMPDIATTVTVNVLPSPKQQEDGLSGSDDDLTPEPPPNGIAETDEPVLPPQESENRSDENGEAEL